MNNHANAITILRQEEQARKELERLRVPESERRRLREEREEKQRQYIREREEEEEEYRALREEQEAERSKGLQEFWKILAEQESKRNQKRDKEREELEREEGEEFERQEFEKEDILMMNR